MLSVPARGKGMPRLWYFSTHRLWKGSHSIFSKLEKLSARTLIFPMSSRLSLSPGTTTCRTHRGMPRSSASR